MRTVQRTFAAVTALTLALALAGCGSSGRTTASVRPVDMNASPDIIVSNAVESRADLSSLSGQGVMRIVDTPNKFGLTVNADVVADASDRLRIRGDKLAGAIQAFDVVMLGEDIGFYVPTQKTLYHGKVDDLKYFSFRFDPEEVLRQMLRSDTSLLLKHWEVAAVPAGDRSANIVLDEVVPPNRPRLRLEINRRTGMLVSVSQLDAYGNPVLVKSYGDYRGLDRGRQRDSAAPVFPYLMALSWPMDNRMMELHFKAVEGDAIVLDKDFDLATSDDTRYMPLVNANMDAEEFADDPIAMTSTASAGERQL